MFGGTPYYGLLKSFHDPFFDFLTSYFVSLKTLKTSYETAFNNLIVFAAPVVLTADIFYNSILSEEGELRYFVF